MNKPFVVRLNNPYSYKHDREVFELDRVMTIQEWVDDHNEMEGHPIVCMKNNNPILRRFWTSENITSHDFVVFHRMPLGGRSVTNEGKLAGGVALVILGAFLIFAGAVLAQPEIVLGALGLIGTGAQLINGGLSTADIAEQAAEPSPNYGSYANSARPGQPIPVAYGRNRIYPDYESPPRLYYSNQKRYVQVIFCLGQGEYDIRAVQAGISNIDIFDQLAYVIYKPGEIRTRWLGDVYTSPEVNKIDIIFDEETRPFPIIYNEDDEDYVIQFDFEAPDGLNSDSVKIILYGNLTITGTYQPLGEFTINRNGDDPARLTFYLEKADARGFRFFALKKKTDFEDKMTLTGLKKVVPSRKTSSELTYTSLVMDYEITENITSALSNKVNVIATRKIPEWSPSSGFSENTATSSPIWAFVDILRAKYGSNISDDKIDLQGLYDLDRSLSSIYEFNGIFDKKITIWNALNAIGSVCRSTAILQGGLIRLIHDKGNKKPVTMYTTRNIVKNTFRINYKLASEETTRGVTIEYINDSTWRPAEVVYGKISGVETQKIKLFGCTNSSQASKIAGYISRSLQYRRKIITFQTELEGYLPTFGDQIYISHDMPRWGLAGDIIGFNPENNHISLSQKVDVVEGRENSYYIALRKPDGSVAAGPTNVTIEDDGFSVKFTDGYVYVVNGESVSFGRHYIYYGGKEERTQFSIGIPSKNDYQKFLIQNISPQGGNKIEITAIIYNSSVY